MTPGRAIVAVLACALAASCRRGAPPASLATGPDAWPTDGWRSATPEDQGVDSTRLAEVVESVRARRLAVHEILVVRRGRVVLDAAFFPFERDGLHDVASVTKSVTATLVGIAIGDRLLRDVRQPAVELLSPGRPPATDKSRITVEQLLTMTSGLGDGRGPESELAQTLAMRRSPDWVRHVLDAPAAGVPGTFAYCNTGYHLLSAVVARSAGESPLEYARRRLLGPLGIRDALWPADPQGVNDGWGDLHLRPRDLAKIGFLYLHGGSWDGRRILDPEWIARSARPRVRAPDGSGYGYGWWPGTGRFAGFYAARGRGGQLLAVSPGLDVIVVVVGGAYPLEAVAQGLLAAIRPDAKLAPNAAAEERLRRAVGEAAAPPLASDPAPLPALARRVSGRTWSFDENPLGVHTLSLAFEDDRQGSGRLDSAFGAISFSFGLDGVPRRFRGGRNGLDVAAVGAWRDGALDLELDELAEIQRFRLGVTWSATGAEIDVGVAEATGVVPPHRLHGREGGRPAPLSGAR